MYAYRTTTVRPSTRMKFARKKSAMGVKEPLISAALATLIIALWYGARWLLSI